jgi:hypothetical protein
VFTDDVIDGYIALKMQEVTQPAHDHAPGRVRHVLPTGASVQRVEIREPNSAPPPTPAPRATTEQQPAQAATPPEPTVTITSPANEATIAMGPGNFTVSAAVAPALSRTERLVLMMDGQPVGAPQESASWFIEGALRGPHDLVVQRTTTRGKTIALSEPVRVYVLRPSIR